MTITHQNQRYIKNILKEYCQKTFEPFLSKKSLIKICNFLVDVCKKRVSCSCCNYGDTMSLQSLTTLTQFPHSQQLFLACVYVVSRHFKGLWHRRRIYLEARVGHPFFSKERAVLSVLFRSFIKNIPFFPFFSVLFRSL